MPDVCLPWGQQELKVSLPEHWTLQRVACADLKPAVAQWPERLAAALNQPATGPSLDKLLAARRNGRIVLVIEDVTRHSPVEQILEVLMREFCHARIDDAQLEVLFATGMHPPMTPQQAQMKLGALANRIRWRSNPWHDSQAYVRVGTAGRLDVFVDRALAAADLRIIVSSVTPHLQAGFGGGYKMFIPGCSSIETIRGLHRLGLGRTAKQLVGTEAMANPMRTAIDIGGQLVDAAFGKTLAVQYVLDHRDLPAHVVVGEPIPTQRMLAKQCAVSCGIIPPAPADVLITNAYPRDFDLWQSFKGIANTLWAAKPNGLVICMTRCLSGANGMAPPRWPLSPAWTRRMLGLVGPESLSSLVMRLVPKLGGDAAFFVRMAAQMCHRNPIFIVSETLHDAGMLFPGIHIFRDPKDAIAAADKMLHAKPQRVTVFPSGGITFPVPI